MKRILLILAYLTLSLCVYGQNTIVFSYDSAGNRIQRDTLTAVSVVLPVEEFHCDLDTINNPQYTAILGEVVISSRGTSPKPIARHPLLEKIKPVKAYLLHKGENLNEMMRKNLYLCTALKISRNGHRISRSVLERL